MSLGDSKIRLGVRAGRWEFRQKLLEDLSQS